MKMTLHKCHYINDIKWRWPNIQSTVMESTQKCSPTGWTWNRDAARQLTIFEQQITAGTRRRKRERFCY